MDQLYQTKIVSQVKELSTHTLVEHISLVPQRRVLTQMLLDPFDAIHLQLLQLLIGRHNNNTHLVICSFLFPFQWNLFRDAAREPKQLVSI